MQTKRVQVDAEDKQLQQWGAQLDDLAAQIAAAAANAQADERWSSADLTVRRDVARATLEELEAVGASKWKTLEAGVEAAYNELQDALEGLGN